MSEHPYGTWPSPLDAAEVFGASVRLGELAVVGDDTYWLEGRPDEGGRSVLVRAARSGAIERVSPPTGSEGRTFDVRTRAQEYGGASFAVAPALAVLVRKEDDRVYRLDVGGRPGATEPAPLTPADGHRYASPVIDIERGLVLAVSEDHGEPGGFRTDPVTSLVAIPLDGSAADDPERIRTIVGGHDFVNTPTLSPDCSMLAYVTWEHPDMPWDSSTLYLADLDAAGAVTRSVVVAGGEGVSAQDPLWTPAGDLIHVDDRTGWWNPYRTEISARPTIGEGSQSSPSLELRTRHLHPAEIEFSAPQWSFGPRTLAVLDEDHLVVAWSADGHRRLGSLRLANGELEPWHGEWEPVGSVAAHEGRVVFLGAHPRRSRSVVELDHTRAPRVLAASTPALLDDDAISVAEPVTWVSGDGEPAHGFFYAPRSVGELRAPGGERAPLLVMIHGGPTAATDAGLDLKVQYWTTRGFAVLDVNYGGSTGYGRAYRERLRGGWGVVDVSDVATGAAALAAEGLVDGGRLAIRGGSAGGFTTLAALAFTDAFAAGTSLYGVSDLAALAQETHKFEARYLDGLVGPYPEAAEVYRERSPLFHVDRITSPVLLLQGSEDAVVPPSQSIAVADALAARAVPVAYIEFEGEGHGFRGPDASQRALEAELAFYGQVFGFTPGDAGLPSVDLAAYAQRSGQPRADDQTGQR